MKKPNVYECILFQNIPPDEREYFRKITFQMLEGLNAEVKIVGSSIVVTIRRNEPFTSIQLIQFIANSYVRQYEGKNHPYIDAVRRAKAWAALHGKDYFVIKDFIHDIHISQRYIVTDWEGLGTFYQSYPVVFSTAEEEK